MDLDAAQKFLNNIIGNKQTNKELISRTFCNIS